MSNIIDLLIKIPEIVEHAVLCNVQAPALYTLRDIVHNMQMVFYWLREGDKELRTLSQEEVLTTDWYTSNIAVQRGTSTSHTIDEYLNLMTTKLQELTTETQNYIESVPLPSTVKYKLEQGYNNMMEASFNTEISIVYYDEVKRKQRGQLTAQRPGSEL